MKKCLIIGSGSAGLRHARNAQILGKKVAVVSSRILRDFKTFDCISEAKKEFNPDFIVIASITADHISNLNNLINLDVPVLVEKPLTHKFDDKLLDFVSVIKKRDIYRCYRVGYLMRYHPMVKQLVRDMPRLGKIYYVHSQFGQFLPWWRPKADFKESYSAELRKGGGVLYDSSHEIDLVQYLFGETKSVSAFLGNLGVLGINSDELCSMNMTLKNDIKVNISLDYLSKIPTRLFRIEGYSGTVIIDFINNIYSINTDRNNKPKVIDYDFERNSLFLEELEQFFDKPQDSILPDLDESIHTLRIFEAIKKSSEEKRWIKV